MLTQPIMCANCGYVTDSVAPATGSDDPAPRDGDFNFCLNCGFLTLWQDGRLRPVTAADLATLSLREQRELQRMRRNHAKARRLGIVGGLARDRGGRA